MGYRNSQDHIDTDGILNVLPKRSNFRLASVFVQDDISLKPDTLRLMLGMRLEHNSYTGFEPQPNARMIWTPNPRQTLWGAVSRAVRTPSRAELDSQLDVGVLPNPLNLPPGFEIPALLRYMPSTNQKLSAEKITAYELGYRHQFSPRLSLDAAAFFNDSENLLSANLGVQQFQLLPVPYILQPLIPNNHLSAQSHGLELVVDYHPLPWWRIQPTYSYLHVITHAPSNDAAEQNNAIVAEISAPKHQLSLRSSMTFQEKRQLDIWLRHMSALGDRVASYSALDIRYAWHPVNNVELSVVGQNLLDRRHPEFSPDILPSQTLQIERSLYFKAKWEF